MLHVFRVKHPDTKPGAPVVFLQHGILDSADTWVMHYVDKAPAFQLAKAGYDVWLGNHRGNKYSLAHKTLSINSKEFWEFSFTELGKYDAPTQVGYALKTAGLQKAAAFIGHS